MKDLIALFREALDVLMTESPRIPFNDSEAIAQFQAILAIRRLWSALPNSRLKEDAKAAYMTALLGTPPSEEHLALATRSLRKRRLTEEEVISLEIRQGSRCALCGVLLVRDANPHVDHVVPVSLGGSEEISNFQLLCGECNLGKGASLHWLMALPFFDERPGNEPSLGLRYSVLKRFKGRCFHDDCENNSSICPVFVVPYVGVPEGGRVIFDNLVVYCETHRAEIASAQMRRAKAAMSRRKVGGFGFGV
ncbi:HNH endonuclease signature motif containing protein [Variovorax sp. J22R133]|uniref:HNH endonuclease n=1 Tax=Variovorax brevis TaxID=3053503 RepID=UPI0025780C5E|nr:HNH endonuclease signature motif containing protein [Variovorax sp. J22R133]MDM0116143.1 HNH endonuclease signature motif containing protein [Variovorax sp. J22R133]